MTTREAFNALKNKAWKYDLEHNELRGETNNAGFVIEALVLATEQAPTFEKLGYVKLDNQDKETRRIYMKDDSIYDTVEFIHYQYPFDEWGVTKGIGRHTYLTLPEILACAEVIKEMEKEKV